MTNHRLIEAIMEQLDEPVDIEGHRMPAYQALAMRLVASAINGDVQAARLIVEATESYDPCLASLENEDDR